MKPCGILPREAHISEYSRGFTCFGLYLLASSSQFYYYTHQHNRNKEEDFFLYYFLAVVGGSQEVIINSSSSPHFWVQIQFRNMVAQVRKMEIKILVLLPIRLFWGMKLNLWARIGFSYHFPHIWILHWLCKEEFGSGEQAHLPRTPAFPLQPCLGLSFRREQRF